MCGRDFSSKTQKPKPQPKKNTTHRGTKAPRYQLSSKFLGASVPRCVGHPVKTLPGKIVCQKRQLSRVSVTKDARYCSLRPFASRPARATLVEDPTRARRVGGNHHLRYPHR